MCTKHKIEFAQTYTGEGIDRKREIHICSNLKFSCKFSLSLLQALNEIINLLHHLLVLWVCFLYMKCNNISDCNFSIIQRIWNLKFSKSKKNDGFCTFLHAIAFDAVTTYDRFCSVLLLASNPQKVTRRHMWHTQQWNSQELTKNRKSLVWEKIPKIPKTFSSFLLSVDCFAVDVAEKKEGKVFLPQKRKKNEKRSWVVVEYTRDNVDVGLGQKFHAFFLLFCCFIYFLSCLLFD